MFQGKNKALTFSFDDGVTQDIRLIELFNKYGLKCTFNLNSELLGKKGMLPRVGQRISHYKIHPEDVMRVYEGHEVAVHTLHHPFLDQLPPALAAEEILGDPDAGEINPACHPLGVDIISVRQILFPR